MRTSHLARLLLLLFLVTRSALGQPWLQTPLPVVPGRSIGPIVLGQPVAPRTYDLLGQPTASDDIAKISSKDGGGMEWRHKKKPELYLNVKCHDGKAPGNVYQVFWTGRNAKARGIGVGSPVAELLSAFPRGHWTVDPMEDSPCWAVPGLNFTCSSRTGRVTLMHLYR